MNKEFNLSDNLIEADNEEQDNGFYWEKDVKKFIKRLKEELRDIARREFRDEDIEEALEQGKGIFNIIDKLAGDKLI